MAAIWSRTRAELRRRTGSTIWLIVFLGLAGGAVLGAFAGARRTDTAYDRMREATDAPDGLVSVEGTGLQGYYEELSQVTGVAGVGTIAGGDVQVVGSSIPGLLQGKGDPVLTMYVTVDEGFMYRVGRPVLTAGRIPDPDRAAEAFANRFLAAEGVRAGSTLDLQLTTFDPETELPMPYGEPITVTIAGTGVFTNEVVPIAVLDSFPTIVLTPAFFKTYIEPALARGTDEILGFDGAAVVLHPGASVTAFREAAHDLIPRHEETEGRLYFTSEHDRIPIIRRSVRPQVIALQIFGALAAATALLLVGQAVTRQLYADASDYATLRALGMTRGQLFTVGVIRAGVIGAGGALIAVAVATLTSPIMPLGAARRAEPSPGLSVDAALLAFGAAAIVGMLLLVIAAPLLRHATGRDRVGVAPTAARPYRLGRMLSGIRAPTAMTIGVRMATDRGRGSTAAPVRSATAGTVIAVIALGATVTFGSSLDRLIDTPRLFGQTWDLTLDAGFGVFEPGPAIDRLNASPHVESFSAGIHTETLIDGVAVPTIGVDRVKGAVYPTMLDGRPPQTDDEIALGTGTLRTLAKRVGDNVEIRPADSAPEEAPRRMLVVGRAVFPLFGQGSFSATGLGVGALTTASVLQSPVDEEGYSFFLVRLRSESATSAAQVQAAVIGDVPECEAGYCFVQRTIRPGDVTSYQRVRTTPLALAGLLALLAGAAVVHALVTSVRRRRRDLAVFKTLGFVRRQVSSTVGWQATTMMTLSLVAGVPLGIAAGRATWNGFAGRLGIPAEPVLPLGVILIGIAAALGLANLAAAWPASRAARLSPAVALRIE